MSKKKVDPNLPAPMKLPVNPVRDDYRRHFNVPEDSSDTKHIPVVRSPEKQEIIIKLLEDYVQRDGIYTVNGFFFEYGITYENWKYWTLRCPNLDTAYKEARMYTMAKRFNDGASRKATESMIKWAGQGDKEVRAYVKYLAGLGKNKDEANSKQDIHVHQHNYFNNEDEEIVNDA